MAGAPAVRTWRSSSCADGNRHAPCRHADTAVIRPGAGPRSRPSVREDRRDGMIRGSSVAPRENDGSPRRIPPFL
jgi:hypothetical protein